MSVRITGYTEANVNGKWRCIDFYQYDAKGVLQHIPCITGQSFVRQALEWDCQMDRMMSPPDDLSDAVREMNTSEEGVLYGTGDERWVSWHLIEGSWFGKVDLSMPDTCGFFLRSDVGRYLSNPDENELSTEKMLSVDEYQALDAEAKKAYQYFEYTDPSGNRQIIRDLKQSVLERMWAFNRNVSWREKEQIISLADIRILVTES